MQRPNPPQGGDGKPRVLFLIDSRVAKGNPAIFVFSNREVMEMIKDVIYSMRMNSRVRDALKKALKDSLDQDEAN